MEINGAHEVIIEFHLKMCMVAHLLEHKSAQHEGTFDGVPKEALRDLYEEAQKGACESAL